MKLLIFAHKKEAASFLESSPFEKVEKSAPLKLYFSEKLESYLLICGQGMDQAFENSLIALSRYPIHKIINMGLCASLNKKLKLKSAHRLKNIYAYSKKHFHHQSFECKIKNEETLNIISTDKKLKAHSKEFALLSSTADLVDMEAWSIAKAAHKFSVPMQAFKIISDHGVNEENDCTEIVSEFKEYSAIFWNYFIDEENIKTMSSSFINPHFPKLSATQKSLESKYYSVIEKNSSKDMEELYQSFCLNFPRGKESQEKNDAKKWILFLEHEAYPLSKRWQQKLKELCSPLSDNKISYLYSSHHDRPELEIKTTVQSTSDYSKKLSALQSLQWQKIQEHLEGKNSLE